MNRSTNERAATALSSTSGRTAGERIADWHRQQLERIDSRIARMCGRGYDRRNPDTHPVRVAADLALERERHLDFIASFRPSQPPRGPATRNAVHTRALNADWRTQLDNVFQRLAA